MNGLRVNMYLGGVNPPQRALIRRAYGQFFVLETNMTVITLSVGYYFLH